MKLEGRIKSLLILIIDSTDIEALRIGLKQQYDFEVHHLLPDQMTAEVAKKLQPDLIVLNVNITPVKATEFLSSLASQEVMPPVILVDANGDSVIFDFDYPNVVGWINHDFTISELALLIQKVLTQPLPNDELIWIKRNDLIAARRRLQLTRDLRLAYEVSRLASSTLDIQQIPRLLLQRTAEIIGAECGSLALIDKEHNGVVFLLAYDDQGNELKGLENFVMPLGSGIVGLVAQTGEPVIVNDTQNHPGWSPLPDEMTGFTTRKLIAVPLIAEGEVLGVMELLNKKGGDFEQDDIQLLSLVASSVASAIQNARQYAALQRSNQALTEAQSQRIAAERWAVLGKATASLAHRINNTTALVPIAAQHLEELLGQVELPPELRQKVDNNLDRIKRNSLYTVDLAIMLLHRFRKQTTEAYDLNELINQALSLVEIPKNVKVVRHLDPTLPLVDTSDLLVDVFVELISNAVRAMADQEGLLRVATFRVNKNKVTVQITDNGPGIRRADIERIFDMFFTTQPSGLGFGLWWVKTFLEQQHGEIVVESCPGENTTFTLTLPRKSPTIA